MAALDKQVGGNHYKDQKLQPIELAYMLGGTPCFCKVAKYCTRNKGDAYENIRKAIHCVELEQELSEYKLLYNRHSIGHKHVISLFTEEEWLQRVITNMYVGKYNAAIQLLRERLK